MGYELTVSSVCVEWGFFSSRLLFPDLFSLSLSRSVHNALYHITADAYVCKTQTVLLPYGDGCKTHWSHMVCMFLWHVLSVG